MIEILPYRNKQDIEYLYKKNNIEFNNFCLAIKATVKNELLGYALFSIENNIFNLYFVETFEDFYLIDGIVRSALHVGVENGVTEAYCKNNDLILNLQKLNFIKEGTNKEININKLFESCCECK